MDRRRTPTDPTDLDSFSEHSGSGSVAEQIAHLRSSIAKTRKQLKAFYQLYSERGMEEAVARDRSALETLAQKYQALLARVETLEHRSSDAPIKYGGSSVAESDVFDDSQIIVGGSLLANPLFNPQSEQKSTDREHRIDRFLSLMVELGASDLHLSVGLSPMFRESGLLEPLRYRRISASDWESLILPIVPDRIWDQFQGTGDADFAYEIPSVGRFRVNLFRQHRGSGAVFRVIPNRIMSVDQLALPEQVHRLAKIPGGLVLITGPTGSGKSTTLAAVVNEINESRGDHIITLEDPIEFVHENKQSLLHQREIGTHAPTFAAGLRDAVREDPNLLLVGEMRDAETIRLALESAEKGLLVFGTLHTNNAAKSVDRIVNAFQAKEQETIRAILADTIRAVLAQQLVRRSDGGRIAAVEILFGSPALASLIREGKSHQITNLIQTGRRQGMISMDESLKQLVESEIIDLQTALEKAIDKTVFTDPKQAQRETAMLRRATAEVDTVIG